MRVQFPPESKENVDLVRRMYAALELSVPGSVGKARVSPEFIDSEIEWQGPREFPGLAEPFYGHEGVARYLAKIAEVLDDYRMVPERFIDASDDRVLVFSREGGRGKGSGAEVQTHLTAHVWTLRDGKAVRMQSYWERADALEAVGLSEQDIHPVTPQTGPWIFATSSPRNCAVPTRWTSRPGLADTKPLVLKVEPF